MSQRWGKVYNNLLRGTFQQLGYLQAHEKHDLETDKRDFHKMSTNVLQVAYSAALILIFI